MTSRGAIVWLDEPAAADPSQTGAKAANLAVLRQRGFTVPRGFCVTLDAYGHWRNGAGAPLLEAVRRAYERLGSDAPVAVRSSANLEDLASGAAAGVFETILNAVGPQAVADAVARCWASGQSARARSYLEAKGLAEPDLAIGVLVQEMVPAEVSGVAFTANPATGNPWEVVVSAVEGLGEAVVGGEECDTFVVDRISREVREQRLGRRNWRVVPVPGGGTRRETVERVGDTRASLSSQQLAELVGLCCRVAEEFNAPQDVEWALAGGRFHLLQSRPITGLPRYFPVRWEPGEEGFDWKLAYRAPFSPFALSLERFKSVGYCAGIREVLWQPYRLHHKEANGFLYFRKEAPTPSRPRVLLSALRMLWLGGSTASRWRSEVLVRFRAEAQRLLDGPTDPASIEQQAARYRRVADLLPWFYRQTVKVNKLMDFHARMLTRLCTRLCPGGVEVATKLLAGSRTTSVERDEVLAALARRVRQSPEAEALAPDAAEGEIRTHLGRTDEGRALLRDLEVAADSCGYIFTGRYPEDPLEWGGVAEALGYLRRLHPHPCHREARHETDRFGCEAERAVLAQLKASRAERVLPLRTWLFRLLVRRARDYYPLKEDHNNAFYEATAAVRRAALGVGRALVAAGHLARPEDVFYLRHEEIVDLAGASPDEVRRLCERVPERAADLERFRLLDPPEVLRHSPSARQAEERPADLAGQPASAGVAEGPARIVLGPDDFARIAPGDVLVCKHFRPYWTHLLLAVSAVVAEEGSILSHAANNAREYGLPAVVGAEGATRVLRDGEPIIVDGSRGRIIRRNSP